jgi:hypothetical protein
LPSTVLLPLCHSPARLHHHHDDRNLTRPCSFTGGSGGRRRRAVDAWTPAKATERTPASACNPCDLHRHLRPRLGRLQPTLDSSDLGKQPPHQTLARGELLACMRQATRTTHPGRRSPPNRTAEAAYRFALHPGLAGEPPRPDPAQIWRSPARSGLFLFFLCA